MNIASDDIELRRSIRLLVSVLTRVREIDPKHPDESLWMKSLLRSINAIAAGMRNTG